MRDKADNCVVICSIENLDPMGVHTGDSITVAPAMTLSDHTYQRMRDMAIKMMRSIGDFAGGCNVQFAVSPDKNEDIMAKFKPMLEGLYYDPDRYETYLDQLGIDYPQLIPTEIRRN